MIDGKTRNISYTRDQLLFYRSPSPHLARATRKRLFTLRLWKDRRGRDTGPSPFIRLRPGNSTTDTPRRNEVLNALPAEKIHFLSPRQITTVGTWNVRSLHTTGALDLLIHELSHVKWDIVGLAETHWTGAEETTHQDYKILSSGKLDEHRSGVALLLTKSAQRSLLSYRPVNDRIISARLQTMTGAVTIIQVYAPTTDATDDTIEEFYDQLQQEVNMTPRNDPIIVMVDLNAKVGSQSEDEREVIGRYGLGERNERGERLLDFCWINRLFITNTKFKNVKPSRCWTWESPDGQTHNKIDFILVSKSILSSVQNSRSFPSADVGSDHQLVLANIKLKLKRNKAPVQNKN